jgi:hypothetical protein
MLRDRPKIISLSVTQFTLEFLPLGDIPLTSGRVDRSRSTPKEIDP